MDKSLYAFEAKLEQTHWWFVGRRRLFRHEIAALRLPKDARVLDAGTSTGTNLRMLADAGYQQTLGLDLSHEAIRFCAEKGLGEVRWGNICDLPFGEASFDLVLATDILEHVDDDGTGAREIARVLMPGGYALITVPAFRSLWGRQDEIAHHFRRYRMLELKHIIETAGLRPLHYYYFNYLLFTPIWMARKILNLCNVKFDSEGQFNNKFLNSLFTIIFYLDIRTAPWLKSPFGVSILLVAKKPDDQPI